MLWALIRLSRVCSCVSLFPLRPDDGGWSEEESQSVCFNDLHGCWVSDAFDALFIHFYYFEVLLHLYEQVDACWRLSMSSCNFYQQAAVLPA